MSKSLLDYAFDYVSQNKEPVKFKDLWAYVVKESQISDELAAKKVSAFFTNLLLDGRFVALGENTWDLRNRHKLEEYHVDMKQFYSDEEASEVDEMDEDEIAYNKAFEEPKDEDAADDSDEASEESEDAESEEQREDR